MKIKIRPLSVNSCWQGKRFKTNNYKIYEKEISYLLNSWKPTIFEKMYLKIKFGFSSSLSDIDNPIKPLADILQKKYGFDDKNIFKLKVEKEIVKKGEEYIYLNIEKYK